MKPEVFGTSYITKSFLTAIEAAAIGVRRRLDIPCGLLQLRQDEDAQPLTRRLLEVLRGTS